MNRAQRRASWLDSHRRSVNFNRRGSTPIAAAVRLRINEMVLHGFAASDRHTIADSTERVLSSQLRERGVPSQYKSSSDVERVDAGSFQIASNAPSKLIGALIAQAIYGGKR